MNKRVRTELKEAFLYYLRQRLFKTYPTGDWVHHRRLRLVPRWLANGRVVSFYGRWREEMKPHLDTVYRDHNSIFPSKMAHVRNHSVRVSETATYWTWIMPIGTFLACECLHGSPFDPIESCQLTGGNMNFSFMRYGMIGSFSVYRTIYPKMLASLLSERAGDQLRTYPRGSITEVHIFLSMRGVKQ